MSFRKRSHLVSALGFALAFLGSEARAAFETFTATYAPTKTNIIGASLSIPAFDSSLGTLESVVLSSKEIAVISATITNNAVASDTFSVVDTTNFSIRFQGSSVLNDLTDQLQAQKNYTLASGGRANFGEFDLSGASGMKTIIDPTQLAMYVGTGNLTFLFSANASVAIGGQGGNVFINPTTLAGTTLTVTYNYINPNIVPEPASVGMTALGGLLVAAAGYAQNRRGARSAT